MLRCGTGKLDTDILKALRSFESSGNTRPLTQSSLPEERNLKSLEVPQKYRLLVGSLLQYKSKFIFRTSYTENVDVLTVQYSDREGEKCARNATCGYELN